MTSRTPVRHAAFGALLVIGIGIPVIVGVSGGSAPPVGAQTDPSALVGEGGSFLSPVTNLLLNADAGLAPLNPQYSDSDLDGAISDFVGSAPNEFNADFVVSERALTNAEAQTATSNGRSFAYVPFAATPVGIATFDVCQPGDLTSDIVTKSTFCQNIPLTPALVGELVTSGLTSASVEPNTNLPAPLLAWNDSRLTQAGGQPIPDGSSIGLASTLSASAENSALMSLLDSDPTAKEVLDNALDNPANAVSTSSDTPNEIWPFHGPHAYVGADEGLLNHELTIVATTNAPGYIDSWGGLGGIDGGAHDVFPVSAVWTGSPEGTPWNVPTAAIENASGDFVGPTLAAATSAEGVSGITLDPTTNLVTFNPDPSDTTAYNNYLMVESYLVVPTTSLASAKAIKLAQFIRFVLGPTGQSDIKILGAAPATPAEVTAGLKVASELDAEAVTVTSSSTTTTTTSTSSSSSSTTTTTAGSATTTSSDSGSASSSTSPTSGVSTDSTNSSTPDSGGTSPSSLAFTGGNPLPILLLGSLLFGGAGMARWWLRRRSDPPIEQSASRRDTVGL